MSINNRAKEIKQNVSYNVREDVKRSKKKLSRLGRGRGRTRRDYRRASRSGLPPQKERDTWNLIGGGYGGGWGILFGPPRKKKRY